MKSIISNIATSERIVRLILGGVLWLGLALGWTKFFAFVLGLILIVEGIVGWCGIPIFVTKCNLDQFFDNVIQSKSSPTSENVIQNKSSSASKDSSKGSN